MTPAELRRLLCELGIDGAQLAKLCGVDRITAWRWRQDQTPVPTYVETLLSLLQHVRALEVHYDVPEASRLSTGSRSPRNGPLAAEEAGTDAP